MLPMMSSFNEVFIDQLKSKVKRGMDDAFRRGDNIQPPGVGYRMVPVTNPDVSLVFTHKNTVEKRAEVDPEAAEWIRRGAEMDRELKAKRVELAEQQGLNRRPPVQRIKEKDVTVVLVQLRDLLQSDVGLAAPVLKELVGDVVIESRVVEGNTRPQMFARFTIDALPAVALIGREPDLEAADGASSASRERIWAWSKPSAGSQCPAERRNSLSRSSPGFEKSRLRLGEARPSSRRSRQEFRRDGADQERAGTQVSRSTCFSVALLRLRHWQFRDDDVLVSHDGHRTAVGLKADDA
jgi:hypothetical protein